MIHIVLTRFSSRNLKNINPLNQLLKLLNYFLSLLESSNDSSETQYGNVMESYASYAKDPKIDLFTTKV